MSASMTRTLLPSERVYMKPGLSAGSGGGQVLWSPLSSGPVCSTPTLVLVALVVCSLTGSVYKARVGRDPLPAPGGQEVVSSGPVLFLLFLLFFLLSLSGPVGEESGVV